MFISHTEESKRKISESIKTLWQDKEYRKRNLQGQEKRKPPSESTRTKISNIMKTMWEDDNYKQTMVRAHVGHISSEETRKKRSEIAKKQIVPLGTRMWLSKKMRENHPFRGKEGPHKGKKFDKEWCDNLSKGHKGIQEKENNPNWQGGISYLPYCYKFNDTLKEKIRNLYDRKCFLCELDEKNNTYKNGKQVKLSVHHIDGDKEQGCNDKPFFLVPLCAKCHAKTTHKTTHDTMMINIKELKKLHDIKEFILNFPWIR